MKDLQGSKRLDDTRCTTHKRRINYRTNNLQGLKATCLQHGSIQGHNLALTVLCVPDSADSGEFAAVQVSDECSQAAALTSHDEVSLEKPPDLDPLFYDLTRAKTAKELKKHLETRGLGALLLSQVLRKEVQNWDLL